MEDWLNRSNFFLASSVSLGLDKMAVFCQLRPLSYWFRLESWRANLGSTKSQDLSIYRYGNKFEHWIIKQIIIKCTRNMYTLFHAIYSKYCGNPEYNIAILGIQNTGKTHIFKVIKDIKTQFPTIANQDYKPTIGLNTTKYEDKKNNLWVWDLGGKANIRKIWESYYSQSHGFIFIIDGRVDQGLECLKNIVNHQEMASIPCVILMRKEDTKEMIEQGLKEIEKEEQNEGRAWLVKMVPTTKQTQIQNRQKMLEILDWLYSEIRKLAISLKY